jgi:uncharacterized membrane protein
LLDRRSGDNTWLRPRERLAGGEGHANLPALQRSDRSIPETALSVVFSNAGNSPLPLVLVALLDLVFLGIEARRYRYFDIWRTRVRLMEVSMYGSLLRLEGVRVDNGWNEVLARDYEQLHFHISFWEAMGRRLRRNYSFLFVIQAVSYVAKICIHPTPIRSLDEVWEHASVGPLPGEVVLAIGLLFHAGLVALALLTLKGRRAVGRVERVADHKKPVGEFADRLTASSRESLPVNQGGGVMFFLPQPGWCVGLLRGLCCRAKGICCRSMLTASTTSATATTSPPAKTWCSWKSTCATPASSPLA